MSHEIFLFIILLFIFGNVWQNHIEWPLRDRKHRMPYLACSMSEENSTQLFRFSKQGTDTGRLCYFYELLFKNKRWECGGLSQSHWLDVHKKMMYVAELHALQWSLYGILNTPVCYILQFLYQVLHQHFFFQDVWM